MFFGILLLYETPQVRENELDVQFQHPRVEVEDLLWVFRSVSLFFRTGSGGLGGSPRGQDIFREEARKMKKRGRERGREGRERGLERERKREGGEREGGMERDGEGEVEGGRGGGRGGED